MQLVSFKYLKAYKFLSEIKIRLLDTKVCCTKIIETK